MPAAGLQPHAAQFLHDRDLALEHVLDTVSHGLLDRTDVLDQAGKPLWFDGGRLVATPHGSVEGDVPFNDARSEGDRRHRGRQTDYMPRVAHGNPIALL